MGQHDAGARHTNHKSRTWISRLPSLPSLRGCLGGALGGVAVSVVLVVLGQGRESCIPGSRGSVHLVPGRSCAAVVAWMGSRSLCGATRAADGEVRETWTCRKLAASIPDHGRRWGVRCSRRQAFDPPGSAEPQAATGPSRALRGPVWGVGGRVGGHDRPR